MALIYLDNAATTRVHPEVAQVVVRLMTEEYGNPSSLHNLGLAAEKEIELAREQVASLLGVEPGGLIFTSGGTEANNLAIRGAATRSPGRLLASAIEHPSVREVFLALQREGWQVEWLPTDGKGLVDMQALETALTLPVQLVSIMAVNNELGIVQPLPDLCKLIRRRQPGALIHTDAVQGPGKTDYILGGAGADLISISAHKFHGPKGVGALYVSRREILKPLLLGGGQQGDLRPGTENVPGIAGLGEAARLLKARGEEWHEHITVLNRKLASGIEELGGKLLSHPDLCAPHILGAYFPGYRGEILLQALAAQGICTATGSACSGKRGKGSHLADALNLKDDARLGQMRFSLSIFNTEGEIDSALIILKDVLSDLSFIRGRGSRNVR